MRRGFKSRPELPSLCGKQRRAKRSILRPVASAPGRSRPKETTGVAVRQRRGPRTSPESSHSVSCDRLLGTATAKWRLGDLLRIRFTTIAASSIVRSSTRRRPRSIRRSPPPRAREKTRSAFSARIAARTTRCAGARRTACLAAAAFRAGAPSISSPTRLWRGCATRTDGSPSQEHCSNEKASARARPRAG